MAFPSSAHNTSSQSDQSQANLPSHAQASAVAAGSRSSHRLSTTGSRGFPSAQAGSFEGDHQLEKLQFALAVALTRGDRERERVLREQISLLGGNNEEPGT